ncbi:MAG TPA: CpsD/CapB family tyrosine-protein kinase [Blastocatellia bacterium]|jgi:Mrp family chromosome partitioning ATPase|nr:CpsD/CapB family tyrosine-protein kinase [Blastocatellia bacterium]
MGKVHEAMKRAESVVAEPAWPAAVSNGGEERADRPERFDFLNYSLNALPVTELEREKSNADATARLRTELLRPKSEAVVDTDRIDPHLTAFYDFGLRPAEEFNKLAITLLSAPAAKQARRVLVTSAKRGDGRTLLTLSLAAALARARQRVLVIDCDLQRPSISRVLGLEAQAGLVEAVEGKVTPGAALIKISPYGFDVLPLRARTDSSAEVLASPGLRNLLDAIEPNYNFILFDSSPLLDAADSNILGSLTDKTMLVVRPGKTSATEMNRALTGLKQESLFGVVLNRVPQ